MVDPLRCFSFQPVHHNKGWGICYPVGLGGAISAYRKPSLLIGNSNLYSGGNGFSPSLSGPLPYARRHIIIHKMC